MDAQIVKMQQTPAKRNAEGEITKYQTGTITLEIPLDDQTNRKEYLALSALLSEEWVKLIVESTQGTLFDMSNESGNE